MLKRFCTFGIIIVLTIVCTYTYASNFESQNPTTNYRIVIEDDANLLTEEEINKLAKDMEPLSEFGNIAFKSTNTTNSSTTKFADDFYDSTFGDNSNGTVFLIDMYNRYIYIFSDGTNQRIITKGKSEIITDNVYRYASNTEYYLCASNAFEQINQLLKGNKINEPMKYISNALISVVIGFLCTFAYINFNSSIKKEKDAEVLDKCIIKCDIGQSTATKVGEHKVYSPQSSDSGSSGFSSGGHSSGGGGGHSSHGSHSSGGGGGHRF